MNFALNRLASLLFLLLLIGLPAAAQTSAPVFLSGSTSASSYPDYSNFNSVPVGKTLVIPVAISGSGPMTYSATSTSSALIPIIKTGYPVMKIDVSYTGTTGSLGTLYTFTGAGDGASPYAGLLAASSGILYGATETGGSNNFGTVFEMTTSGSLNTLYTFTGGDDGGNPFSALIPGANDLLFGTAETGGSNNFGTVYQLTTTGSLSTLYTFSGAADGGNPYGGLLTGTDGLLYGTTETGPGGYGTVYQLTKSGSLNTLHTFDGGDGASPQSQLVLAANGNFYGTTVGGGANSAGTVFSITPAGAFNSLHSFNGLGEGGSPYGAVITGTDGNLYGTTETGGSGGTGTIYQLTTTGSLTLLHSFGAVSSGSNADGANPRAGLVQASDGNFYGTTGSGGSYGFGTVFQVTTSGSFSTLYSFTGGNDGGNPYGILTEPVTGDLFGTTITGGADGHGTVFQIPLPNAGDYNGYDFFRITNLEASEFQSGFIAQAGSQTNTNSGTPGFAFDNEFNPSLIFAGQGQLAMANGGFDSNFRGTNGSQFFITGAPLRFLDFEHTIFGQLLTGFDVLQQVLGVPLQATTDGSTPSVPVAPVVMTSVTVSEDNTDAILLVSGAAYLPGGATIKVNATDSSKNKAVSVSGTTSTTGLAFSMATSNDTEDDPPIVESVPDVNAPLHKSVTVPIKIVNLQFDYMQSGVFASTEYPEASVSQDGVVRPLASSPIASVNVGVIAEDVLLSGSNEAGCTIGLGLGNLTPLPAMLTGSAGEPLAPAAIVLTGTAMTTGSAFGSFMASDPMSKPTEYTATINWGDGVISTSSNNVSIVRSPAYPTGFDVVAPGHTYENPGIYPLNITVTDSNGGMLEVQNTAVISATATGVSGTGSASNGEIYPYGRTFSAPRGLANCVVANFVDKSPAKVASDYTATINWGDGVIGIGTIRESNGSFEVLGKHQYVAGTFYPVDVTISFSGGAAGSGYAWSAAHLSGVAAHQPPFAQSHITGQIGNPGFNGDFLDEEVTLVNSGNLSSGPISLQFYLSPTDATQPIDPSAIPLSVSGHATYNTPSIGPGGSLEGSVSNITLPSNVQTQGKWIIMQVITNDPIANHMDYPHAFADPSPLLE
jgi:uncharacterized repeat protein (TIGR03803 family)